MTEDNKITYRLPMGASREQIKKVWEVENPDDLPIEVQDFISERAEATRHVRNTLEMLEGTHVLEMIEYIDAHSPLTKSDVYTNVSRSSGVPRKLDDLVDMGLIRIYVTGRTNLNVISITPKGHRVAVLIRNIIDTIDNWEGSGD